MIKNIGNIGALALSLFLGVSQVNSELPIGYKEWPLKQVRYLHTTYKKSWEKVSEAVRVFPKKKLLYWTPFEYQIIGYNPGYDGSPRVMPIEFYISLTNLPLGNKTILKLIESYKVKECGQCHIITNFGNYY